MRNPNGFGCVVKLSNNRRNPYGARITKGYIDGKQKYLYIGYFKTKSEAYKSLAVYYANPFNIKIKDKTFKDLFEEWKETTYPTFTKSTINAYNMAFNHCKALHDKKFIELKTKELQIFLNNSNSHYPTLRKIKVLFHQLYKYALQNDYINKDYSSYINIGSKNYTSVKKPFTKEEINRLWLSIGLDFVDTVLIMIYTGLRVGELLIIKKEDCCDKL